MNRDQVFDFLELANDALSSLFGRIIGLAVSFFIGCALVSLVMMGEYLDYGEAFTELMASFMFSIFSVKGLTVLPILFLFSIGFVKYEWPIWALLIPFGAPWIFIPPSF